MAQFGKIQTLQAIIQTGVVPVYYSKEVEVAKQVVKICYEGGVRTFKFTNRGDFVYEVFGELVKCTTKECPELVLGVGSIVDPAITAPFVQLGASFIVGSLLNPEIAKICNHHLAPYTSDCGPVSEIGPAQETGCGSCKMFPVENVGGPSFVKNMRTPMPWTLIMITGTVEPTEENLSAWFRAGVVCVGMGFKFFPKEATARNDWQSIASLCRSALSIIQKYRQV